MELNYIEIKEIDKYSIQIIDNVLKLERIEKYISKEELLRKDLRHSSIIKCSINREVIFETRWRPFLVKIYRLINDTNSIYQNTTLNAKKENLDKIKGFHWYKDLGLSIQGVETKKTLIEIIKMSEISSYIIEMSIKLKNKDIIHFRIN